MRVVWTSSSSTRTSRRPRSMTSGPSTRVDGDRRLDPLVHLARAAQQCVAAGGELVGVDRARHDVVGAGVEHGGPDAGLAFAGDAEEVLLRGLPELFVEGAPIGRRQERIDDQDVR